MCRPALAAVLLLLGLATGGEVPEACTRNDAGQCRDGDSCALLQVGRPGEVSTKKGLDSAAAGNTSLRADLEACLRRGGRTVWVSSTPGYAEARQCANTRADIIPRPVAVLQAADASDVQQAVRCARQFGLQVCAKSGSHGFDNAAGCTGGVQVDLKRLMSTSVDSKARRATVGAGHTNGQLYWKLAQSGLAFPGGAVAGVGLSGLTLGCGRGMLTWLAGMACDSIETFKFVDAQGDLKAATQDLLWFARGGGGQFPGIVVEWTLRVYPMPQQVLNLGCRFSPAVARTVLNRWFDRCDDMSHPGRKIWSEATWWNAPPSLQVTIKCLGCDAAEQQWARGVMSQISAGLGGSCSSQTREYLDEVYADSGGYQGAAGKGAPGFDGLLDWNSGWGKQPTRSQGYVTGRMGEQWSLSDGAFKVLDRWTRQQRLDDWVLLVAFYPVRRLSRPGAYGNDEALWNVHITYHWPTTKGASYSAKVMQHARSFQQELDAHLPCKNLYNYIDQSMTCASSNEAWLEAYFSDVPRMRSLKQRYDPTGVFRSRLGGAPSPAPPPPSGCAGDQTVDCRSSRCCLDPSRRCYEKNSQWAACLTSCIPGLYAHDPPQYRTPWSCEDLTAGFP